MHSADGGVGCPFWDAHSGIEGPVCPITHSGRWVLHFQHMFMLRAELLCFPPLAVLSV